MMLATSANSKLVDAARHTWSRTIPILRSGVLAGDFCRWHSRAEVAAVFKRSIFLRHDDAFVCLAAPSIGNGPLTLIAEFNPSGLRRGEPVSVTERDIAIGDTRFNFDRWELWRPPPWPRALEYGRLIKVCRSLAVRMTADAPAEGLGRIYGQQTATARIARPRVMRFESWLRDTLATDRATTNLSSAAVHDLIGMGHGLTPSGDDFLAGALAVLDALVERKAHAALARAITAAPHGLTSPLSHCLVSAAAAGHVGERLHLAVSAITMGDVDAAIASIRTIGHSSGWDMLAGATATLAVVAAANAA